MEKKDLQKYWWKEYLGMMTDISGWLVLPIVFGLVAGKWLDNKYQTKPWLTLLFIAVAFVLSIFGILREAKLIMKKMENEKNKDTKSDGKP